MQVRNAFLGLKINESTCWSFNGLEPGGSESKREKEADILWFMLKARACAAARRHQVPSREGLRSPGKKVSSVGLHAPRN